MAVLQQQTLPQQYVNQLGQDYGQQLAGLTSIPLDTAKEATEWIKKKPTKWIEKKEFAGGGIAAGMRRFNRGGKV